MSKVEHLSQFPRGSLVYQVFGRNYEDAVVKAGSNGTHYYCQLHGSSPKQQSILVAYNKKENEYDQGTEIS